MRTTHEKGLIIGLLAALLSLVIAAFHLTLSSTQQGAIYAAGALLVATLLAAFHVAAGEAAAGLPMVDFHSTAFWVGAASTVLAILTVVFRVSVTPSMVPLILTAVGSVAAVILGLAHVAAEKQAAAPRAAPAPTPPHTG
jgi:uncharacterized membrane protein